MRSVIFLVLFAVQAEAYVVKFKDSEISAPMRNGDTFQLLLNPLLVDDPVIAGVKLRWKLSPDAPEWLSVSNGILEGIPENCYTPRLFSVVAYTRTSSDVLDVELIPDASLQSQCWY